MQGRYDATAPTLSDGVTRPALLNATGRVMVAAVDDLLFVDATFVADTSILASGDVITSTLSLGNIARDNGGGVTLRSLNMYDQDDQGTALDLFLFRTNVSLGTVNSAPSISDANALEIAGLVQIAAADFSDLGGVRVATKGNLNIEMAAAAAARTLFASLICRSGTPTYTASGLKARLVFRQH